MHPRQWAMVRRILQKHVPGYEVWAFGSRAKRTAKPHSDLDLVIISDRALPLDVRAALRDDFSESDLPWKVISLAFQCWLRLGVTHSPLPSSIIIMNPSSYMTSSVGDGFVLLSGGNIMMSSRAVGENELIFSRKFHPRSPIAILSMLFIMLIYTSEFIRLRSLAPLIISISPGVRLMINFREISKDMRDCCMACLVAGIISTIFWCRLLTSAAFDGYFGATSFSIVYVKCWIISSSGRLHMINLRNPDGICIIFSNFVSVGSFFMLSAISRARSINLNF